MNLTTRFVANTVIIGTTIMWTLSFFDYVLEQNRMAEQRREFQRAREQTRPELKRAKTCLQEVLNHEAQASIQRKKTPIEWPSSEVYADQTRQEKERFCREQAKCYVPVLRGNGMTEKQIFDRAFADCLNDDLKKNTTAPTL